MAFRTAGYTSRPTRTWTRATSSSLPALLAVSANAQSDGASGAQATERLSAEAMLEDAARKDPTTPIPRTLSESRCASRASLSLTWLVLLLSGRGRELRSRITVDFLKLGIQAAAHVCR